MKSSNLLRWSPEVRELLGDDVVRTLRRKTAIYTCVKCDKNGRASRERTHVIVVCSPGRPNFVQFAHARCAPSQIVRLPAGAVRDVADIDFSEEVVTSQILLPTSEGYLPGLIIDRPSGFRLMYDSGDVEDMWTQLLLRVGWDLVLNIGQPCPQVATTTVELSPDGAGRVVFDDPDKPGVDPLVLADRLPVLEPEWLRAAATTGWVLIFAGTIGSETDESVTEQELAAAVSQGHVVGALVPITVR
ncbi:hypothetical protein [Mycolicibacterium lutetiense]